MITNLWCEPIIDMAENTHNAIDVVKQQFETTIGIASKVVQ